MPITCPYTTASWTPAAKKINVVSVLFLRSSPPAVWLFDCLTILTCDRKIMKREASKDPSIRNASTCCRLCLRGFSWQRLHIYYKCIDLFPPTYFITLSTILIAMQKVCAQRWTPPSSVHAAGLNRQLILQLWSPTEVHAHLSEQGGGGGGACLNPKHPCCTLWFKKSSGSCEACATFFPASECCSSRCRLSLIYGPKVCSSLLVSPHTHKRSRRQGESSSFLFPARPPPSWLSQRAGVSGPCGGLPRRALT